MEVQRLCDRRTVGHIPFDVVVYGPALSGNVDVTVSSQLAQMAVPSLPEGVIVLFDAECVLCSANAQFILTHDQVGRFYLASMQGAVGAELFRQNGLDPADPTGILVIENARVHWDSDAVIAIYEGLGFPWRFARVFRIVPAAIRDPIYRLVARNRYRLFGKRETCWLPAERYRSRLL